MSGLQMPGAFQPHESAESGLVAPQGAVPYLLPIALGGSQAFTVVYGPPPGQWSGGVPMVAGGTAPMAAVREQPVAAAMPMPVAGQYPMVMVSAAPHAYQAIDSSAAIAGAGTMAMLAPAGYSGIAMTAQGATLAQPTLAAGPHGTLVQLPTSMQPWLQPAAHAAEQPRRQEETTQEHRHDNRSQGSYEHRKSDQSHDNVQHQQHAAPAATDRQQAEKPQGSHVRREAEAVPQSAPFEKGKSETSCWVCLKQSSV